MTDLQSPSPIPLVLNLVALATPGCFAEPPLTGGSGGRGGSATSSSSGAPGNTESSDASASTTGIGTAQSSDVDGADASSDSEPDTAWDPRCVNLAVAACGAACGVLDEG